MLNFLVLEEVDVTWFESTTVNPVTRGHPACSKALPVKRVEASDGSPGGILS